MKWGPASVVTIFRYIVSISRMGDGEEEKGCWKEKIWESAGEGDESRMLRYLTNILLWNFSDFRAWCQDEWQL
jgi:hypothetical protein